MSRIKKTSKGNQRTQKKTTRADKKMKKNMEIKYQTQKKIMAGRMVFIINIFDEILDREVPASLHHGFF
jgi:hypothetical protein